MFKNAIVFRLPADWVCPDLAVLEDALHPARFVPCGPSQRQSLGWIEPRGDREGALVESVGGEWLLRLLSESKVLPASVVKERVAERCAAIEAETGLKPGAKARRELKEELEQALMAQAFTRKSSTLVWISPRSRWIVVDAPSLKRADAVLTALANAFSVTGAVPALALLNCRRSPAAAMGAWLAAREAPAGFTIDRDCELRSPDAEKATVRYRHHALDIEEIVAHLTTQGKVPVQLALTHVGRDARPDTPAGVGSLSFLLTDGFVLKRLQLEGLERDTPSADEAAFLADYGIAPQPGASLATADEAGFDGDAALITGALSRLIPDLIEALDGEVLPEAAGSVAAPVAPASPATSGSSRRVTPAS
jgi:recombination associated protein RdgC